MTRLRSVSAPAALAINEATEYVPPTSGTASGFSSSFVGSSSRRAGCWDRDELQPGQDAGQAPNGHLGRLRALGAAPRAPRAPTPNTEEAASLVCSRNWTMKHTGFPHPDSVAAADFAVRAAPFGLSDEALRALAPRAARDSVTGFFDARQDAFKAGMVRRAQGYVAATPYSAFFVSGDVNNLGGLNAHFDNVAERANAHYREIAVIVADEAARGGADVIPMRTGGDEVGLLLVGPIDARAVNEALRSARARIQQYASENGLAAIPHPKRSGEKGVGMHLGMAEVLPRLSVSDIVTAADLDLNRSKGYVR